MTMNLDINYGLIEPSLLALGVINVVIMSGETKEMFLTLFLTLAGCSLLAVPVTAAVSSSPPQGTTDTQGGEGKNSETE